MKLTKYLRQAFVSAAMNDVPSTDYAEQARSLAQKTLDRLVQTTFVGLSREVIDPWLNHESVLMPSGFNNLYYATRSSTGYSTLKEIPEVWAALEELSAKHRAQKLAHEALKTKLTAVANSATTRKALAGLLPEFEKYLPADNSAAIRTLPAIANVMADFITAGWPKGTAA